MSSSIFECVPRNMSLLGGFPLSRDHKPLSNSISTNIFTRIDCIYSFADLLLNFCRHCGDGGGMEACTGIVIGGGRYYDAGSGHGAERRL